MAVDGHVLFRSLMVVFAGVVLICIIFHYNRTLNSETFQDSRPAPAADPPRGNHPAPGGEPIAMEHDIIAATEAAPVPPSEAAAAPPSAAGPSSKRTPPSAAAAHGLRPEDLLPKLGNSREEQQFAQLHPGGQGDVQGVNFLDAGSLIGQITTPDKNPNLQLRTDPVIEKKNVSPWNMSTFSSIPLYRTFELGSA